MPMWLRQEVQALPWGAVGNGALSCFIVEAWTTAIFAAVLIFLTIREKMIEEYQISLLHGDTVEEWRAQDARLAGTAIGQLLQARHSITEEILDLQDDSNDYG